MFVESDSFGRNGSVEYRRAPLPRSPRLNGGVTLEGDPKPARAEVAKAALADAVPFGRSYDVEHRRATLPLPPLLDGGVSAEGAPRSAESMTIASALGAVARTALEIHAMTDDEAALLSRPQVSDKDVVVKKVEVAPGQYEVHTRHFTSTSATAPAALARGVAEGWVTEGGSPVIEEHAPYGAALSGPEDSLTADESITSLLDATRIVETEAELMVARAAVQAAHDSVQ
jgi:hypothetical protein